MVAKKIPCAKCQKKCSGNVLRYQDRYYHKHCLDLNDNIAQQKQQLTQNSINHHSLSTISNSDSKMIHSNNNSSQKPHVHARGDTMCSKCSSKSSSYSTEVKMNANKSPTTGGASAPAMKRSIDAKRPSKSTLTREFVLYLFGVPPLRRLSYEHDAKYNSLTLHSYSHHPYRLCRMPRANSGWPSLDSLRYPMARMVLVSRSARSL